MHKLLGWLLCALKLYAFAGFDEGMPPRKSEWNAAKKDQLEVVLYRMVCDGSLPLATAQQAMATDWIAAWKRYVAGNAALAKGHVD